MKTTSFAAVLSGALLLAAPALAQTTAPSRAPAQGAAAATLPDAFEGDAPAASTPPASPPNRGATSSPFRVRRWTRAHAVPMNCCVRAPYCAKALRT